MIEITYKIPNIDFCLCMLKLCLRMEKLFCLGSILSCLECWEVRSSQLMCHTVSMISMPNKSGFSVAKVNVEGKQPLGPPGVARFTPIVLKGSHYNSDIWSVCAVCNWLAHTGKFKLYLYSLCKQREHYTYWCNYKCAYYKLFFRRCKETITVQ